MRIVSATAKLDTLAQNAIGNKRYRKRSTRQDPEWMNLPYTIYLTPRRICQLSLALLLLKRTGRSIVD